MIEADELIAQHRENERCFLSIPQPSYSSYLGQLMVGDMVVKEFRHAAPNQELLLVCFEEASWPFMIDDPLPVKKDKCPRERIANAVKRLNRSQRGGIRIHFRLRNSGESICWRITRTQADPREPVF